jgi:hypothetical protein
MPFQKTIYIKDFTGICNRLESLVLAFAIRATHGHNIKIDWPESDALTVQSVCRGKAGLLSRLNSIKVRTCDYDTFSKLGAYRNIHLRGIYGQLGPLLDSQLDPVIRSLRVHPDIVRAVEDHFASLNGPVIGIHLRRGDFLIPRSAEEQRRYRHAALPDHWICQSLASLSARFPGVSFHLSATGNKDAYRFITDHYPCRMLGIQSPYHYKGPTHASECHPVADLFALASCNIILATPRSSFSHWAANCLGNPSWVIVPRAKEGKFETSECVARHLGRCRLPTWMEQDWDNDPNQWDALPDPQPADTSWIPRNSS